MNRCCNVFMPEKMTRFNYWALYRKIYTSVKVITEQETIHENNLSFNISTLSPMRSEKIS